MSCGLLRRDVPLARAARLESRSPFAPVAWGFSANNARGSCPCMVCVVVPCGGPVVSRVSVPRLVALADGMPLLERQIVETVARLTLVSGRQLSDLFFYFYISDSSTPAVSPSTRARRARRVLARLVEQRVLDRLERRQGGIGGGSSAWVYALGPAGRRMVAYWAGEGLPRSRGAHEPGATWTAHTLAVSDLYVRLRQAERAGRVELLDFDAEPAC